MNLLYYKIIRMVEGCRGWMVGRMSNFSLLNVVGEYCKLKYKDKLALDVSCRECDIVIKDGKYLAQGFYGWGMSMLCKINIIERGTRLSVFVFEKDFIKCVRDLCGEEIDENDI